MVLVGLLLFVVFGSIYGRRLFYAAVIRRANRRRWLLLAQRYPDPALRDRLFAGQIWQGQTEQQLGDALGPPAARDVAPSRHDQYVLKFGPIAYNQYRLLVTMEKGVVLGWEQRG